MGGLTELEEAIFLAENGLDHIEFAEYLKEKGVTVRFMREVAIRKQAEYDSGKAGSYSTMIVVGADYFKGKRILDEERTSRSHKEAEFKHLVDEAGYLYAPLKNYNLDSIKSELQKTYSNLS